MKPANLLLILIVATTIVAGFLLAARYNPSFINELSPTETPQAPVKEMFQTTLSLEPQTTSLQIGQENFYSVIVDPGSQSVFGVSAELYFDPNQIKINSIEPAEYFEVSDILINTIDPQTGKIFYALGTRTPVSGQGAVFRIHFTPLQVTSGITNLISFDKDNTSVALQSSDKKAISKTQTVMLFEEQPITVLP